MRKIFVFIAVFLVFTANAIDLCTQRNTTFKAGEELNYELYYNLSFIWVHAGNARFSVRQAFHGNKPAYQLQAIGTTIKSFDNFFRVRDTLTTFVDTTYMAPFSFCQSNHEDNYWKKTEIDFRKTGNEWTADMTAIKRSKIIKETVSSEKCFFDILSCVYQFRNIDTSHLQPNQQIPFQLVLDDGLYPLHLRYVKTEEVKLHNNERYRCLVFKPMLVEGDVFKNADGMTIWVTDDENKIPVYIESKIRVGSLKAQVNGMKNLRHKSTAKVTKK
ncbi:MAG: DUF3108 domain-containing protein [Prevotellaceae bacterium]|jgi:hypothetical protein|nr:DUF3108 domain-containing protein [Prevotellaceae bacterium]